MKEFTGKLALVTGGSSGIGLAISKKLARQGCDVWILARRPDQLADALVEIRGCAQNSSQNFGSIQADVSEDEAVSLKLAAFCKEVGVPDLLINDAGVSRPGLFSDQDIDIFRWMMNTNFLGAVCVTRALISAMIARGSGHIVNVSSIAGYAGIYGYSAYGASKFALRGFSDTLRAELVEHHIQVSVVFPPDTKTPQLDGDVPYLPAVTRQLSEDNNAVKSPEQVADSIIQGIQKNHYLIFPGFDSAFLYYLQNFLGPLTYPFMDLMVSGAKKKVARKSGAK
jgi:3-dehydrosphinganine reductase